ncbi:hypothetical protein BC941DRAFT_448988 [Chlamydoabsidia padenii]|nr:hypothetical protein BC941DRAFT_448988 [Chlamydoabsidia padenii]
MIFIWKKCVALLFFFFFFFLLAEYVDSTGVRPIERFWSKAKYSIKRETLMESDTLSSRIAEAYNNNNNNNDNNNNDNDNHSGYSDDSDSYCSIVDLKNKVKMPTY